MDQPGLDYYTRLKREHIRQALKTHDKRFAIHEYVKLAETHWKHGNPTKAEFFVYKAREIQKSTDSYKKYVKSLRKELKRFARAEKKAIKSGDVGRASRLFHQMQEIARQTSNPKLLRIYQGYLEKLAPKLKNAMERKQIVFDSMQNLIISLHERANQCLETPCPFVGF